jgi:hypothetical protein
LIAIPLRNVGVGLDFCSPNFLKMDQSNMNKQAVFLSDFNRNLADCFQKGWLSISPAVPPISVMTTSALDFEPTL